MTLNERKELKIVIWTVKELFNFILDQIERPGLAAVHQAEKLPFSLP
jgi:hypothetical protein